jgi:hypothetical protein
MTTPTDIIRQAISSQLCSVHTCLPAEIVTYDYTVQKATVQPLLRKRYRDGTVQALPEITNVPVIFPRSSSFSMHYPLNQGDNVMILFSERSIDQWLTSGGEITPLDSRKFDLSDAIAIPGLYPFSSPSPAEDNTSYTIEIGSAKFKMDPTGTFCMHGVADELLDLISQIVGQLIVFNGANGGGPVVLNPAYLVTLNALQAKINVMKGSC